MFRTTDSKNHCRKYLPHIEDKKLQFITFRLYDSLPQSVIEYCKNTLQSLKKEENKTDVTNAKIKECLKIIDKYEDAGYGQCFLQNQQIADLMANTLKHNDNKLYKLYDWCIMPNHVHVMIKTDDNSSLSQILHAWRSYTAHKGNEILGRKGKFWMNEYFDRYIREEVHGLKVSSYITMNPVKAGLVARPEEWRWSSAYQQ